MKKIIILKVQNVVNNTAEYVIIGICNSRGEFVETKILPGIMFDQRIPLEKGMELKLVPISSLC